LPKASLAPENHHEKTSQVSLENNMTLVKKTYEIVLNGIGYFNYSSQRVLPKTEHFFKDDYFKSLFRYSQNSRSLSKESLTLNS
tara:strand:- start:23 stop:274 length:252 start_codon:yes stop_codon:yes gene_type:complete